ncbi:MAG: PilZ domain-containing protein [Gammaproteobacteria bacterium]|nr:PilZ domain-containing protein [Gammaproteobacteria bacterium]
MAGAPSSAAAGKTGSVTAGKSSAPLFSKFSLFSSKSGGAAAGAGSAATTKSGGALAAKTSIFPLLPSTLGEGAAAGKTGGATAGKSSAPLFSKFSLFSSKSGGTAAGAGSAATTKSGGALAAKISIFPLLPSTLGEGVAAGESSSALSGALSGEAGSATAGKSTGSLFSKFSLFSSKSSTAAGAGSAATTKSGGAVAAKSSIFPLFSSKLGEGAVAGESGGLASGAAKGSVAGVIVGNIQSCASTYTLVSGKLLAGGSLPLLVKGAMGSGALVPGALILPWIIPAAVAGLVVKRIYSGSDGKQGYSTQGQNDEVASAAMDGLRQFLQPEMKGGQGYQSERELFHQLLSHHFRTTPFSSDRRSSPRLPVPQGLIEVIWVSSEGKRGKGTVVDVSTKGIRVEIGGFSKYLSERATEESAEQIIKTLKFSWMDESLVLRQPRVVWSQGDHVAVKLKDG